MSEAKQPGFTAFWSDNYFPALDGLRALSILLVFFAHIHVPRPEVLGWIGVYIFFVLSGFLITTLLIRESEHYGRFSLRGFYIRRFFRIVPIYFLVLAVYVPVILLMRDTVRWAEFKLALPYLLTFMQEFRPSASGLVFGQAWSLGIEEKYYLLWPLLTLLLFPFKRLSTTIVLAVGAALFLLPFGQTVCYGSIFLGSLVAIVLAKSTAIRFRESLSQFPTSLAAMLVAAAYIVVRYHFNLLLLFPASIALLIGTLVLRTSWLRNLLEHPWIVLAGKRSYAMYLIHVLVIHVVEGLATSLHASRWYTVVPVAYLFSFAGASMLFYLVERPCLAYGRRLSKRIRESQLLESRPAYFAMSSSVAPNPLEETVAPIEREEPGVPNAFADDGSKVNT